MLGVFFCNCFTAGEVLDMIVLVVATDEYGDDEELNDGKEYHEQAK